MKLLLGACVLLISTLTNAASLAEVDAYVQAKMQDHLIPGLALVVIRDGAVLHRRGFGELDAGKPIIIGSLSKAVTATAVLMLVEEGKIDLDAPMMRYLPELKFADAQMASVTVRQLLHQTSGIPAHAPRAKSRDASLAEHVQALQGLSLVATPGEHHLYSSPNYQLLGRIVEVLSGQSFGAFVQARIFEPLQMTASSTSSADSAAAGHNLWWGLAGPSTYRWEAGRLPTASIVASADDLARFVLFQLGIGPQLLTPQSRALLQRGGAKTEYFSYAMGWREGTTVGVDSLWHGGALPSYRGAIVMLPQSQSAVIVLTNMSSMFADHTREIAAGVVAHFEQRPLPSGVRPLRHVYALIAAGSLLLLGFAVWGLIKAVKRPVGKPMAIVLFDLVVPLVAILAAPKLLNVSYTAMWEGAPDICLTIALAVLLGMVGALLKLRRRTRAAAIA